MTKLPPRFTAKLSGRFRGALSILYPFPPPQAPFPMGFSRQEYWNGLPFPSLGDLPNPGIKPMSPALQADFLLSEPPGKAFTELKPQQMADEST